MPLNEVLKVEFGPLAAQIAPLLSGFVTEVSQGTVERFLRLAFLASLEREEGRALNFALALVDDAMLQDANADGRNWRPIRFSGDLQATVRSIAKLAPAIDYRQSMIVVAVRGSDLHILGIVRTSTAIYRFSRGKPNQLSLSLLKYAPLVASVTDIGTVRVSAGSNGWTISKGVLLPDGLDVFGGGRVFKLIEQNARAAGLDRGVCFRLLRGALHELVARGHGGAILFTSHPVPEALHIKYQATSPSKALQDVLRFAQGESLVPPAPPGGFSIEISVSKASWSPEEEAIEAACSRRLEEYEFLNDGSSFAADLASVDGALVLGADFTVLGFGARIAFESPPQVKALRALDVEANETESISLDDFGTRHNSAARFSWNTPDGVAFVVSQDGVVSVLWRDRQLDYVTIWRPVALENPVTASGPGQILEIVAEP